MRLTDVMSGLRLEVYAEIGLVIFIAIFVAIVVWTFSKRQKPVFDRARYLPLEEGDGTGSPQSERGVEG